MHDNDKNLSQNSQCRIQKKFGDSVSSWGSDRLPQYEQNFIDCYCFAIFQPLRFSFIRCSFKQHIEKLRNVSDNNNFVLAFFIFGDILFWAPIKFERYHFQSKYDSPCFTAEFVEMFLLFFNSMKKMYTIENWKYNLENIAFKVL